MSCVRFSHVARPGFKGRAGLYEQFIPDEALREMVAGRATVSRIRAAARQKGFRTLWDLGLDALKRGLTSPEELLRVVPPGEFESAAEEA